MKKITKFFLSYYLFFLIVPKSNLHSNLNKVYSFFRSSFLNSKSSPLTRLDILYIKSLHIHQDCSKIANLNFLNIILLHHFP